MTAIPIQQDHQNQNQNTAQNQGQHNMASLPQKLFSDKNRVLHVLNLPYDTLKEEVNDLFTGYEVEHIELIKMKSGNPSGTALAQFSTQDQAMCAFQLNQMKQIRGQIIYLKPANENDIQDYHDGEFCAKVRKSGEDYKYARKFDRYREHYEYFSSDIRNDIKEDFKQINAKINDHFTQLGDRFTRLDDRFTRLEDRFTRLDDHFTRLDDRFTRLDDRFTRLDDRITHIEGLFTQMDDHFTQMGRTLDKNFAIISDKPRFEKL